jgi:hypothetical protein
MALMFCSSTQPVPQHHNFMKESINRNFLKPGFYHRVSSHHPTFPTIPNMNHFLDLRPLAQDSKQ